ncbi:DNA helicase II [Gallibacterium anatis]|uniref:DNA 3'-5' helicase n=1 Tax=Gallibacterium anatis TaxID=750 RepID=A0A0A2YI38_9PAST|nr:DNA helicase II [Gallibacterium anatis]KGQ31793.1 DNA-dependent helicase II [Gallibacterium anatis]KGQ41770.1 DNA-dependent helicase II [Gallibacterium anatis IPDH697-78]KGQ44448.1 DNA-dependent helicase II [Gallibacterium anatis]KGQ44876.1 DNA-dependent helicase II [Gallibacterium anatis]KGQ54732.1 DNA-dependent helicase II [Gallibacterium anatis DSM 16844 = F 149]
MDFSELLDGLNERQREAVAAPLGNYLVLAGAGSGKTRVLTYRIAWLIGVENVSPNGILAVTFTNKAAAEMRHRIEDLLQDQITPPFGMWVGTFHSLAHRLLRRHAPDAGLPADFQILDSEDQLRLVKRLVKSYNLDEGLYPPKQICWYINNKKDLGLRADQIEMRSKEDRSWVEIYKIYQDACDRAGLVDFAELLLRTYELWQKKPLILQRYQQRFQHILVDEFQDTNNIQYEWVKLLAGNSANVMIVGDDDQSIYGWRGAKIDNIYRFLTDYHAETIRLEQNYRSTENILQAANILIANNEGRLGKNLWTEGNKGDPVGIYRAFNEHDEARFVTSQIKQWVDEGGNYDQCAVLYRSNRQSRILEEAFLQSGLPYRIYGGLRFFERQEIKDALGYLRLLANRQDDVAFERVVNTPTRGIGDRTLEILRDIARKRTLTLWQATHLALEEKLVQGRAASALLRFIELINALDNDTFELPLAEQTEFVIEHSGLKEMYQKEKGEKGEVRLENLDELVFAARDFQKPDEAEEMSDLIAFLTHASLEAGEGQASPHQQCVDLMTLHSSKGLEFDRVFIVGMEEGLFPSGASGEEGRIEEERRLAYVGITRARKKLTLCYAEQRRVYSQEEKRIVSRFINELPEENIQEIRLRGTVTRAINREAVGTTKSVLANPEWKPGQRVKHHKFGYGSIINVEGSDKNCRLQIAFQNQGIKWLIAHLANLEKL